MRGDLRNPVGWGSSQCGLMSARPAFVRLRALGHVRAKHGVDAGLVAGPLGLEPREDVGIHTQRDGPLGNRLDDRRPIPEVTWQVAQFGR